MIDVGLVHPQMLPVVWGDVCEIVQAKGQDWLKVVDLEDIACALAAGKLELWIGTRSEELELVAFCSWERHAKQSYFHIMWIGGRKLEDYLKPGLEKLEQAACIRGATEVVFNEGRPGWSRVLQSRGYTHSVAMKKNVQVCWRH